MRFQFCTFVLVISFAFLAVTLSFAEDRIWLKDVKVNGRPVRMLFDSDADGNYVALDSVKRLGLKVVEPPTNGLPGYTAVYTVDLKGSPFQTDFGILKVPAYAASDFDAILGWWTLHSSTFRLDGGSRRITFLWHVPREARNWTKFMIMTNSGTLDLEVPHNDGTKGIVTVDTGNWFGIGLSPSLCRQWKNLHPHFPMTLRTCMTPHGFAVVYEAFADKIDIGPLHITDVPILQFDPGGVIAPKRDNQDAILGLAALSRLDLIVDGRHNVAYLRAKTTPAGPFTYNRLGAVFVGMPEHPHQGVAMVVTGSPAYDAGIRDGDILVRLDEPPPFQCEITNWTDKFDMPAGTKLRFTLQRNGTNFETVATLREILMPSNGRNELMDISTNAQFYYSRANIEGANGDDTAALADCDKAIELEPDYAAAYYCRASVEAAKNDAAAAFADYSKAIELKPDYADAYFYRGGVKWTDGDLAGALADYNRAIELKSDTPEIYFSRANLEQAITNIGAALADYSKAIELKPDYVEAYFWRGHAKRNDSDLDGALADLNKAIELKPGWAEAHAYRGDALREKGDLDGAETDNAVAAKLNPSFAGKVAQEFLGLGWLRYERQEYTNALSDFRKACELGPTNDYAQFGIWLSSSLSDNSEQATEELKGYLAARQNPDDWASKIGDFLTGQMTEEELLAAADSADPTKNQEQHCEAYFYIGSKRLVAGDKVRAIDCFKKCVATGVQDFAEYGAAKAELKNLEGAH